MSTPPSFAYDGTRKAHDRWSRNSPVRTKIVAAAPYSPTTDANRPTASHSVAVSAVVKHMRREWR